MHGVQSHIKYTVFDMHATGLKDADGFLKGQSDPYVKVQPYIAIDDSSGTWLSRKETPHGNNPLQDIL